MNMKKLLNYTTKVNYATSKSQSLKTVLPKEISEILGVEAEDMLEWCVNLYDEKIVVTIQKYDNG